MPDQVFQSFLRAQFRDGMLLSEQSDLVRLDPLPLPHLSDRANAPSAYAATFHCKGLKRIRSGEIVDYNGPFVVGIQFPNDYLRQVDPSIVVWLSPRDVFHPNIRCPHICLGRIAPGTGIVDLCYQIYEIVSYQKWTPHDALSEAAAQWARKNTHRFPVDRRALRRSQPFLVQPQD